MGINLTITELIGALDGYISLLETMDQETHGRNLLYLNNLLEKAGNLFTNNQLPQTQAADIADYLILAVQAKAGDLSNGLNLHIGFEEIQKHFSVRLNDYLIEEIRDDLNAREEVADLDIYDNEFDLLLFGAYAPNYEEEEDEE